MAKYEALINYLNHEINDSMDSDTYQHIESVVRRVPTRKRMAATEFNLLLAISRDRLLFGAVGHRPRNSVRFVDFKLSFVPECENPEEDAIADLLLFLHDYAGSWHVRECDWCGKWYCQGRRDGLTCSRRSCTVQLSRSKAEKGHLDELNRARVMLHRKNKRRHNARQSD